MIERVTEILRGLTLQNILTLGLLAAVLAPSWFAWRFMQDEKFRHEFMSTYRTVEADVPCQVVLASVVGQVDRFNIAVSYQYAGRIRAHDPVSLDRTSI